MVNEAMQQVFYCSRQILDGPHTVPISTFSPIAGPEAPWCACGLSLELLAVCHTAPSQSRGERFIVRVSVGNFIQT